jgi:hypothetical protein
MATLDPKALYHRTLGNMFAKLPYIDYEIKKDAFEEAAQKTGITLGTAYKIRDRKLVPVLYVLKKDQDFKTYATPWEILHSKLPFTAGTGKADPVVDENMTVIGHIGWFGTKSVYVPAKEAVVTRKVTVMVGEQGRSLLSILMDRDPMKASAEDIKRRTPKPTQVDMTRGLPMLLNDGVEVHVDNYNESYLKQGFTRSLPPQTRFRIVTCPEGRAQFLAEIDDREAVEASWVSPLDLILIAKLVVLAGVELTAAVAIRVLARPVLVRVLRGAATELASGATRELGSGAAREEVEAATREVASGGTRDGARELAGKEAGGTTRNVRGGNVPPPPPPIPQQIRTITQKEMLAWEKEGGHTLQNHNPLLTRQQLRARIIGKEEIPAPQIAKGGVRGPDMRVWQGAREEAASKWASEETMHKTISDVINKNLEMIRSVTKRGGKVALEKIRAGYTTGSGWITTAGKAGTSAVKVGESAMFFSEELTGVTIYIEPTTANAEGWFVRTAFPEMVE